MPHTTQDLAAIADSYDEFTASVLRRIVVSDALGPEFDLVADGPSEAAMGYAAEAAATSAPPIQLLFSPSRYRRQAQAAGLPAIGSDWPLLHWLEHGLKAGLAPTQLFDAAFYREASPDISGFEIAPFVHYAGHGVFENRRPHAWFDPGWRPRADGPLTPLPAYLRYLLKNLNARQAPFGALQRLLDRNPGAPFGLPEYAGLIASTTGIEPPPNADEVELAAAMMAPPIAGDDLVSALCGFWRGGPSPDASPSPVFDAPYYRRQVTARSLPGLEPDQSAFRHWVRHGIRNQIPSTPLLDPVFYARAHSDVGAGHSVVHFPAAGVFEGRASTVWFDLSSYVGQMHAPGQAGERPTLPPFLHYLAIGIERRLAPVPGLRRYLENEPDAPFNRADYEALVLAAAQLPISLDPEQLEFALALFAPEAYRASAGLDVEASDLASLLHFFGEGLVGGVSPSPLFDSAVYAERAALAGLPPLDGARSAFLHWLEHGVPARIVPTPAFDEAAYLRLHPELGLTPAWSFLHFAAVGAYDGWRADERPAVMVAQPFEPGGRKRKRLPERYRQLAPTVTAAGTRVESPYARAAKAFDSLLDSPAFRRAVRDAAALEPAIGSAATLRALTSAPLHDRLLSRLHALRRRLPRDRYSTIVCIPWGRMGGADLVAALLSSALLRLEPGEPLLIVTTDYPHWEWPEWFPPEADIVHLSDVFEGLAADAEPLFHAMLMGLAPTRVFNVNSRLCWGVYRRYGERLARSIDLFAYLFCMDQTPDGEKAGYPVDYFADTVAAMKAYVTDTAFLKAELIQTFALPAAIAGKIAPLYTPAGSPLREVSAAEAGVASAGGRSRQRILWAGRLDLQKRFDLAIAVARGRPDMDFDCWGAAMMDNAPDLTDLPPNMTMRPPFAAIGDLPLGEADGWLYTAAWDGLPTLLIELAAAGMPVVASAVGGVPELITARTGWPVIEIDDVDGYVRALDDMLARPEERVRRAAALQALVSERHRPEIYQQGLGALLGIAR